MLDNLKSANAKRWQNMSVNQNAVAGLDKVAARLIASKSRYQAVEKKTGVPWPVIAVIHEREASQSWMANIAQGDRWDRVSTHIPRGQGPFASWEDAAVNALRCDHLSTWGDWSIGGTLTALEKYNGLGYANKGRSSPYVWSKSDQYRSGKYVADGVYDPNTIDVQNGCAPLLKRMMVADPTIQYWNVGSVPAVAPKTDTSHHKAAAAVVVAGGVAATQVSHPMHWVYFGIGTLIIAGLIWFGIRYFNKGKTNVA